MSISKLNRIKSKISETLKNNETKKQKVSEILSSLALKIPLSKMPSFKFFCFKYIKLMK